MKTKKKIVYDNSFGFGPMFRVAEAEFTAKMVEILPYGPSHRLTGFTYANATPELIAEAKELKRLYDELHEKAQAFREKLQAAEKGA